MPSNRTRPHPLRLLAALTALVLLAAACGGDDDGESADDRSTTSTSTTTTTTGAGDAAEEAPATTTTEAPTTTTTIDPAVIGDPIPTPTPTVELPPDVQATFWQGTGFDPALVGYERSEFFVSGTARSFTAVGELASDGRWVAEPAEEAAYKTRVVVMRPSDSADFNGTVIVEWFNVTGGLDAAPVWTNSHVEQIRQGFAYVGVSAQFRGISGGQAGSVDLFFPIHLQGIQPERYKSLLHPGDSFSYDIFSQIAQALRNPGEIDILGGLEPSRMIASGESQSASRMTTYVNAVDPLVQLFDGFLIYSRGAGSTGLSQDPQESIDMPSPVYIRDDVRVPVLIFQAEGDVAGSFRAARQPDTDMLRIWEVTGTAHQDLYGLALDVGPQDLGDDPSIADVRSVSDPIPGIITCDGPINDGPSHWVLNAAVYALDEWVGGGALPPSGNPLLFDGDALATDEWGNALGGIRTAWVDVPVATLTGAGSSGSNFCGLFGSTELFDDATLAELYPTKTAYLDAMTASVEQSVADGFLRPADAELILANAATNLIGTPG